MRHRPVGPGARLQPAAHRGWARASARLDDPSNDAQKGADHESYAEIVEASIVGLSKNFRMTMRFDGTAPDRMPSDKTHRIVAFGITGQGEEKGYLTRMSWLSVPAAAPHDDSDSDL